MKNIARALPLLALLLVTTAPSCATTGATDAGLPPAINNFVGFVADCGKVIGGAVAGDEVVKVETALTNDPLDFGKVDSALSGAISDLTSAGFLESQAINFVACVVKDELGRATSNASYADSIGVRRANNARSWIDAHQVTFAAPGPTAPSAARSR